MKDMPDLSDLNLSAGDHRVIKRVGTLFQAFMRVGPWDQTQAIALVQAHIATDQVVELVSLRHRLEELAHTTQRQAEAIEDLRSALRGEEDD